MKIKTVMLILSLALSNNVFSMQKDEQKSELIEAAFNNSITSIERLLKQGVDVNEKNKSGNTALMIAAANGNTEMLEILIYMAKANVNIQDCYGNTPLMWAVVKGYKEVVNILINANADVNIQNHEGRTALIYAVGEENKDIIEMLVKADADLNIKDYKDKTALIYAKERSQEDIADFLILTTLAKKIVECLGMFAHLNLS